MKFSFYKCFFYLAGLLPALLFGQTVSDSARYDIQPDAAFEDKPYEYQVRLGQNDSLIFEKLDGPGWLSVSPDGLLSGLAEHPGDGLSTFSLLVINRTSERDTVFGRINIIEINDPPLFSNSSLPDAVEDSSYIFRLEFSDEDDHPDSLFLQVIELPHWLKLENRFWLRGLPDNNDVSDSVTVRVAVRDRQQAADTLYARIAVLNSNDNPNFVPVPARTVYEDFMFSDTLKCSDEDGDSLVFRGIDLPQWLALSVDGILSGTPGQAQVGHLQAVKIVALDGHSGSDTLEISLQVINTNDRPRFSDVPIRPATEDEYFHFALQAFDEDGDTLFYRAINAPPWLKLDSLGVLRGTPRNSDRGSRIPFSVRVSDPGALSDTLRTFLVVVNSNDAPQIKQAALGDAFEDQLYRQQLTAADPDGDSVRFEALSLPPWLNLSPGGLLSGTPLQAHVAVKVPLRISVTDGKGGLDSLNVNIAVINRNDPPRFKTTNLPDAFEDKLWKQRLIVEDEDNDRLQFEALQAPAWITLFDDGRLQGLPRNDDVSDSAELVVAVSDNNGAGDTLKTTFKVINTNDKPHITTASLQNGREDFAYLAFISASDEDGDSLRFKAIRVPSWLKVSGEGRLDGMPLQADVGKDISVRIETADGNGGKDTLNVVIAVQETPDAPYFTNNEIPAAIEDEPYQFTFQARDEDSDRLAFEPVILPSWLKLDPSGNLSGLPLNEHVSEGVSIRIVVRDETQLADTLSAVIRVINVNDPPVLKKLPPLVFDEDDSTVVNLAAYLSDVDNVLNELSLRVINPGSADGVVFRLDSLSNKLHIAAQTDLFGSYGFVLEVRDPGGLSDRDTVLLTIRAVNDAPEIRLIPEESFAEDHLHKKGLNYFRRFVSDVDDPLTDLKIIFRGQKIHSAFNVSDSSYRFSAPANWFGRDSVNAVVTDKGGLRDSSLFAVNVLAVNDPPVLQPDSVYRLKNNEPLRLNLRNYLSDVDDPFENMDWNFEVSSDSIVLFDSDSILTIISRDFLDTAELRLTVRDTSGAGDSALVRLTVDYPANQYDINGDGIPEKYVLFQNHPNPFNASTSIRYGLPEKAEVKIDIYNTLGQKITTLLNTTQKAGFQHIDWEPTTLASGLYFYRLYAKGKKRFQDIKKLVLVR